MRFSIRDLLWATALVAMGLGWWVSYRAVDTQRIASAQQAHRQRATLDAAKESYDGLISELELWISGKKTAGRRVGFWHYVVDWTVLDEPLVEP